MGVFSRERSDLPSESSEKPAVCPHHDFSERQTLEHRRASILLLGLAAMLFFCIPTAHAQGCSMCRDTTAGSAPQVRAALRKAIPVLAIPAIVLFAGFFVLARRSDAWQRAETNVEQLPDDN
jgi:hypothetical protein